MRTLPPYYAVIAFLAATGAGFHWKNLVFLQNFDPDALRVFAPSWSLVIEEWFYVFVPMLIFVLSALAPPRARSTTFFAFCGALMLCALIGRLLWVDHLSPLWTDVHKNPLARMDSLGAGVLLAGVKAYAPRLYARLQGARRLLFPIAVSWLILAATFLGAILRLRIADLLPGARTLFFSALALPIGLVIVSLESSESIRSLPPVWVAPIRLLSDTSYAVYLLHGSILLAMSRLVSSTRSLPARMACYVLTVGLSLAVSLVFHRVLERPVLRLRDRWTRVSP